MRFDKVIPSGRLAPYIKHFIVSENPSEDRYKVFPTSGMVIGFQYRGRLSSITEDQEDPLAPSGITGIADTYKLFQNSAGIGTILAYLTETGLAHFSSLPANDLFNQSISLEHVFDKARIRETEEKLFLAKSDRGRIHLVEQFFLANLKNIEQDRLIVEAVRLIYQSNGSIKIKDLSGKLFISQSPFEKRFRKLVGTTPKKFASVVRFNTVLNQMHSPKSLLDICYENNFFDQAHFIKDFRQFTGDSPEHFKRFL